MSQMINFRRFQTDRYADDTFKFDENGRKFSKRVENAVGKEEVTHYEQLRAISPFATVLSKDLY